MFVIADDEHAEELGSYAFRAESMTELQRLAQLSWDKDSNRAPCQSWRTCRRSYVLIEYDASTSPWRQIDYAAIFEMGSRGVVWAKSL